MLRKQEEIESLPSCSTHSGVSGGNPRYTDTLNCREEGVRREGRVSVSVSVPVAGDQSLDDELL